MLTKTIGNTTVLSSLQHATSSQNLGYLMNLSLFAKRNPTVEIIFGTTRNEAFHMQLKSFFRNIYHQTGRNATLIYQVATLVKLIAGNISKCSATSVFREHQLLRSVVATMRARTEPLTPKIRCKARKNPKVDVDSLPPKAKTLRKRPASALAP